MEYIKEFDNVFDELNARGYFEQATDEKELRELLKNEKVPFYIGLEPLQILLP